MIPLVTAINRRYLPGLKALTLVSIEDGVARTVADFRKRYFA